MKISEWRVSSNYVDGKTVYEVYRMVKAERVNHSGCREYAGGTYSTRAEAQAAANRLNEKRPEAETKTER